MHITSLIPSLVQGFNLFKSLDHTVQCASHTSSLHVTRSSSGCTASDLPSPAESASAFQQGAQECCRGVRSGGHSSASQPCLPRRLGTSVPNHTPYINSSLSERTAFCFVNLHPRILFSIVVFLGRVEGEGGKDEGEKSERKRKREGKKH